MAESFGYAVGQVVGILLFIGIPIALVVLTVRAVVKRRKWRRLSPAEQAHQVALKQATREVKQAEREYKKGVKAAEKALSEAKEIGYRKLGSFADKQGRKVEGFEHRVVTPNGTFTVDPELKATVDTAGNLAVTRRATLTRIAAGGMVGGGFGALLGSQVQKKSVDDARELYLLLEGSDFVEVVECKPEDGAKVRSLAAQLVTAGKRRDSLTSERESSVKRTTTALEQARTNTQRLDAANAALRALQENAPAPV